MFINYLNDAVVWYNKLDKYSGNGSGPYTIYSTFFAPIFIILCSRFHETTLANFMGTTLWRSIQSIVR